MSALVAPQARTYCFVLDVGQIDFEFPIFLVTLGFRIFYAPCLSRIIWAPYVPFVRIGGRLPVACRPACSCFSFLAVQVGKMQCVSDSLCHLVLGHQNGEGIPFRVHDDCVFRQSSNLTRRIHINNLKGPAWQRFRNAAGQSHRVAVFKRQFGPHKYQALPRCRKTYMNLRHTGDCHSTRDPSRVPSFFAYFFATCLTSISSGRRRRLPLRVRHGNGASVSELELLSIYVDASDMRVNESCAEKDGDREVVRDDKRNSERRVLKLDDQADDRGKPKQIAVRPGQPWQWRIA